MEQEKPTRELEKEKIVLDAYQHGAITQHMCLTYKEKEVALVEGITLNAITDPRTNPSEGLQQLRKDIKEQGLDFAKKGTKDKTIILYVCPMCGYKFHTKEDAMDCCSGK